MSPVLLGFERCSAEQTPALQEMDPLCTQTYSVSIQETFTAIWSVLRSAGAPGREHPPRDSQRESEPGQPPGAALASGPFPDPSKRVRSICLVWMGLRLKVYVLSAGWRLQLLLPMCPHSFPLGFRSPGLLTLSRNLQFLPGTT